MKTTMGEYVIGAYLKQHFKCDVVDYNVRPPDSGVKGLAEFDVVGLRFSDKQAYICEVVTHLKGMRYGSNYRKTIERVKEKHKRQRQYAEKYLSGFTPIYMLWSPVVPKGLAQDLQAIQGLKLYTNQKYKDCVDELRADAQLTTRDTGNPFFRVLQILEHLRGDAPTGKPSSNPPSSG